MIIFTQYCIRVTHWCAKFNKFLVVGDGAAIELTVTNLWPVLGREAPCAGISGYLTIRLTWAASSASSLAMP